MNLERCKEAIKRHEGEVLEIYIDSLGFKTLGVGHLCQPEDPEYDWEVGTPVTQEVVDMYYQDDFAESFLEMRRDVSEDEAFERTFVLPQNAIVDEEDKLLVRHLTYLQTRTYSAYAWPK